MKQKVFYLVGGEMGNPGVPLKESMEELQKELDDGWCIATTTAQKVSTGSTYHLYGGFLLTLERES